MSKNLLFVPRGTLFLRLWLLLFASISATVPSSATVYTIGAGTVSTTTSGITPFTTGWEDNRTQYLYLASELTGAGAAAGMIQSIGFNITQIGSPLPANVNIKVGTVPPGATMLTGLVGGLVTYFTAGTLTPTIGWNTFNLTPGFIWNGTDNIVVEVCRDNNTYNQNYGVETFEFPSGDTRTFGYHDDGVAGCSMTTGTTASATNRRKRPNCQFDIISLTACGGIPVAGTASGPINVCSGVDFNLSLSGFTSASGISIQWESSPPGAGTWSQIPGANTAFYTLAGGQTIATDYRAVVTCSNGGGTDFSNIVAVSIEPFYHCYCTSGASNSGDGEIFNVTFGSMNNTSTCAAGNQRYSDFRTSVAAPQVGQGASVPFSVTAASCGSAYPGGLKIFIDLNRNGLYTDVGEEVFFQSGFTYTATGYFISGSISIPMTALQGITGMRVIMAEDGTSSNMLPCGSYDYGETEDYVIEILAGSQCSGIPAPGVASAPASVCSGGTFSLSLAGYPQSTGITFQWESSPGGASAWTPITGATTPVYAVAGGQTVNTDYRAVVTCVHGGGTNFSNTVSVGMMPGYNCYCMSTATQAADGEIFNVTFGSLNNTSTCVSSNEMYTDYRSTASVPQVGLNTVAGFSVNAASCGSSYGAGLKIFIDYNGNGSFSDAGEEAYFQDNFNYSPAGFVLSGNILIPGSASLGVTGMRVILQEGGSATNMSPCGTYDYGETEDYLVEIVSAPSCFSPVNLQVSNIFSNSALLSWTPGNSTTVAGYEWRVFAQGSGPGGVPLASGVVSVGTSSNISGLAPSTNYAVYVRTICGPNDSSAWISTGFVTTCAPHSGILIEEFNSSNTPGCWSNTGPEQWLFSDGPGPDYGVAGSADHTGNNGFFAWVDGSGSGTNTGITLTSIPIDITAISQPALSYYMKSFNNTDGALNKLIVEVLDGSNWIQIDSVQMNYPTSAWYNRQVAFPATVSSPVQIRFIVDESNASGFAFHNDLLIDDVQILSGPLAVDVLNLEGKTVKGYTELVWHCESSRPGERFYVERGKNTDGFTIIDSVDVQKGQHFYKYADITSFSNAHSFYRVKRKMLNGQYAFSNVIRMTGETSGFTLRTYPNPFAESVFLETDDFEPQATVTVSDVEGRIIRTVSIVTAQTELKLGLFPHGVYLIKYCDSKRTVTRKVIKK